MTIKELCRLTGQDDKTIYRKIGKMKDNELAGHVKKIKGEGYTLDQYAVDLLTPDNIRLKNACQRLEILQTELDRYRSGNTELADKLRRTAKEYELKCRDCDKLNIEIKYLNDTVARLQKHVNELSEYDRDILADLKNNKKEYDSFMEQHLLIMKEMQEQSSQTERKLSEALSRCDTEQKENAEKQREIDRLTAMLGMIPEKYKKKYIPSYTEI